MVYAVSEIVFPLLRPSISKQLVILQHCPFIKWLFWENCIWESFLYCVFMQSYFSFADFFPGSTPFTSFPVSEIFLLSAAAAQQTAHCWMKLFTVHWTHLLIILIQLKVLSRPSFFPCSHFPHHSFWWNSRSLFEKPFGFFQRISHFLAGRLWSFQSSSGVWAFLNFPFCVYNIPQQIYTVNSFFHQNLILLYVFS